MSVTEAEQATPQKNKLRLPNLEIRNIRAFEHLVVERLGRVNLITGRNNVGKTSLLEAVYLFARAGAALPLRELLYSRDEFAGSYGNEPRADSWGLSSDGDPVVYPLTIRHLFHGHQDFDDFPEHISIGPIGGQDETLVIGARWCRERMEEITGGLRVPRVVPLEAAEVGSSMDAKPFVLVKMGSSPVAY
jgi:hypothetical protein